MKRPGEDIRREYHDDRKRAALESRGTGKYEEVPRRKYTDENNFDRDSRYIY